MRVLAVTNMYPTPYRMSLGIFVEQQVKGLREIGVKVEVLYLNRFRDGADVYSKIREPLFYAIHRYKPDLVAVMYGGVMAYKVTQLVHNRAVVVSFCGSDLLGENYSGLRRRAASLFGVWCSRRAARTAAGVVVKSPNLRRALPSSIPEERVRVVANGVDLVKFRPMRRRECQERLGWSQDEFHVLFPSNSGDPVKQPELAKGAVKELVKMGVPAQLHFLKGVSHEMVPTWLNASDVLLLTSRQEGSPNVVKEALACNRPVVSVDVGDVAERISRVKGCHIGKRHAGDLAAKLHAVWQGERVVEGRAEVRDLSLEAVAHRLMVFYQERVENWRRERAPKSISATGL